MPIDTHHFLINKLDIAMSMIGGLAGIGLAFAILGRGDITLWHWLLSVLFGGCGCVSGHHAAHWAAKYITVKCPVCQGTARYMREDYYECTSCGNSKRYIYIPR